MTARRTIDPVRASRDGDQFHYYWAARRCLQLLSPASGGLTAIAIEGLSEADEASETPQEGVVGIDVAEYDGGACSADATAIRFVQLKHSTLRAEEPWSASGLAGTLRHFADRFKALDGTDQGRRVSYQFVTNRPVAATVTVALARIAEGLRPTARGADELLRRYLKPLSDEQQTRFARQFEVVEQALPLKLQIDRYRAELTKILPGFDEHVFLRLFSRIEVAATTRGADHNTLQRNDVLAALGVSEGELRPAQSNIEASPHAVDRADYRTAREAITRVATPTIVHGSGGTGKTQFVASLEAALPSGSVVVAYDCFGDGNYLRERHGRHTDDIAFVQLANDLALRLNVPPLFPALATASPTRYRSAFLSRLTAAATELANASPKALLVIAIDAADNAAEAAQKFAHPGIFVTDLLAGAYPNNVRLVCTARSERVQLLDPPPEVQRIELSGLSPSETAAFLRQRYGQVTGPDATVFHYRTAGNPRVQSRYMESADSAVACVAAVSAVPPAPAEALERFFDDHYRRLQAALGAQAADLDRVCALLGKLRPRIPIETVADLADVSASFVRTVSSEWHGAIRVHNDLLQFTDEPTERWFQGRFAMDEETTERVITRMRTRAGTDAYLAAALPQFLWDTNRSQDLITLALSDASLPSTSNIERREVDQQRVMFALQAALTSADEPAIALLATRGVALTNERAKLMQLLARNTALAGRFLTREAVSEVQRSGVLINRRAAIRAPFEAAMLAEGSGSAAEARAILRSGLLWFQNHVEIRAQDGHRQADRDPSDVDILTNLTIAILALDGPDACVDFLSQWRASPQLCAVGKRVAAYASQLGRQGLLSELLERAADAPPHLRLAFMAAASFRELPVTDSTVMAMLEAISEETVRLIRDSRRVDEYGHLRTISVIVSHARRRRLASDDSLAAIMRAHLPDEPPRGSDSQYGGNAYLPLHRAQALRRRLEDKPLTLADLIPADAIEETKLDASASSTGRHVKRNFEPLPPALETWADVMLTSTPIAGLELVELLRPLEGRRYWGNPPYVYIRAVSECLSDLAAADAGWVPTCGSWFEQVADDLHPTTIAECIATLSAPDHCSALSAQLANEAAARIAEATESAEERIDSLTMVSNAVWRADEDAARFAFDAAMDVARTVDHESLRLVEITNWATAPLPAGASDPDRAHRLAGVLERLDPYFDGAVDTGAGLRSLAKLDLPFSIRLTGQWHDRRFQLIPQSLNSLIGDDGPLHADPTAVAVLATLAGRRISPAVLQRLLKNAGERQSEVLRIILSSDRDEVPAGSARTEYLSVSDALHVPAPAGHERPYAHNIDSDDGLGYSSLGEPFDSAESQHEREAALLRRRAALSQTDFTDSGAVAEAVAVVRRTPGLTFDDLTTAAFSSQVAAWPAILAVLRDTAVLSGPDWATIVRALLDGHHTHIGLTKTFDDTAAFVINTFTADMLSSSYREPPIKELAALTRSPEDDIRASIYRAMSLNVSGLRTEGLLGLAKHTIEHLQPDDAISVLDLAIGELERNLPPVQSGTAEPASPPVGSTRNAIAELIWEALGDPARETRWRAAHAVVMAIELRADDIVDALGAIAIQGTSSASDPRLPFYRWHATTWLLFAVHRAAAHEAPSCRRLRPVLLHFSQPGHGHLITRVVSARAIAALDGAPTPSIVGARDVVDATHAELFDLQDDDDEDEDAEARLPSDFDRYWVQQVARAFAQPLNKVRRRVVLHFATAGHRHADGFVDDPRITLGVLRPEDTSMYQFAAPKAEGLDFYLAFTALLTTAQELLDEASSLVRVDPESPETLLEVWLRSHLPAADARWMADIVTGPPDGRPRFPRELMQREMWPWSVQPADFIELLESGAQGVQAELRSFERRDEYAAREEVRCVFVRGDAAALIATIQTSEDPPLLWLPYESSDSSTDPASTAIVPAVALDDLPERVDDSDPRAHGLRTALPRPATWLIDVLGLRTEDHGQRWTTADGSISAEAAAWSGDDHGYGRRPPSGRSLSMPVETLLSAASRTGLTPVFVVKITRTLEHDRYTHHRSDDPGINYDYFRAFILEPGPRWRHL